MGEIIDAIRGEAGGGDIEARTMILWHIRLPRIATALLSGAAPGLSGAIFQGLLLNPLADPYTLGVSSGAAFGAALIIVGGMLLPGVTLFGSPWGMTAEAFGMACLTLLCVMALAAGRRRTSVADQSHFREGW